MMKTQSRKIISLGVAFYVFAFIAPWVANAQEDLRAASEVIKNQRKHYIEKVMQLTPQEKEAFWRLYAEYESGLAQIRAKRIELAIEFIKNHADFSDAEALDMLNQKLKIDGDELKFKQAYVAKFRQVLPGRKVVRLYQAENRFDTAATSELYRNVPVIQ